MEYERPFVYRAWRGRWTWRAKLGGSSFNGLIFNNQVEAFKDAMRWAGGDKSDLDAIAARRV